MSQLPVETLRVDRNWLARFVPPNTETSMLEVVGDSMEPTLADGDVILVRHDIDVDDVARGGVFVISLDGFIMVKRLQIGPKGEIWVLSDNDRYERVAVPASEAAERVIPHAKVFWSGGPLKKR